MFGEEATRGRGDASDPKRCPVRNVPVPTAWAARAGCCPVAEEGQPGWQWRQAPGGAGGVSGSARTHGMKRHRHAHWRCARSQIPCLLPQGYHVITLTDCCAATRCVRGSAAERMVPSACIGPKQTRFPAGRSPRGRLRCTHARQRQTGNTYNALHAPRAPPFLNAAARRRTTRRSPTPSPCSQSP